MEFKGLENMEQLQQIFNAGERQIIFKHNTTCPISKGVYAELQSEQGPLSKIPDTYLLDIHQHRDISNTIAGHYGVPHQSPQLLVIEKGKCIYHEWGYDISAKAIEQAVGS